MADKADELERQIEAARSAIVLQAARRLATKIESKGQHHGNGDRTTKTEQRRLQEQLAAEKERPEIERLTAENQRLRSELLHREMDTVDGNLTNEQLKAKFDKTPELRAEFDDFESYCAYARAAAAGCVRIK